MDLTRLEQKIEKLDDRLDIIDKTLIRNTASLEEHMRRSAAAEEAIDVIKQELRPVQAHVHRVDGALKLIGVVSVLLGIFASIIKLIGK